MTTEKNLKLEDKMGFALGTGLFFVMLPLSLFMASIPSAILSVWIKQPVLFATASISLLVISTIINFVVAMVFGLLLGHFFGFIGRKIHLEVIFQWVKFRKLDPETKRLTPWGALGGGVIALFGFIVKGRTPLDIVTERVEHLFPAPLVLNLGELSSFNLSHSYAVLTGFLTVSFLFAIGGIGLGCLAAAFLEQMSIHDAKRG